MEKAVLANVYWGENGFKNSDGKRMKLYKTSVYRGGMKVFFEKNGGGEWELWEEWE